MVTQRRIQYTPADLELAIAEVLQGKNGRDIARTSKIPYITVMRKVRATKAGTIQPNKRRGPKPVFPEQCEADLVDWIAGMQMDGFPPDRAAIIVKVLGMESCVPQSTVSTSPKGFMNEELFEVWLRYFAATVDASIQRPLLLVFDGLSSHYSGAIVALCESLQIVLLCLPSNATHLFQPMDVCVFGPYKTAIRHAIFEEMVADEQMKKRLKLFQDGGVPLTYIQAAWLERQPVIRRELLCLPAKGKKIKGRKTIDVAGRILTMELMAEMDSTKEARRDASERKKALKRKWAKKKTQRGKKSPGDPVSGDRTWEALTTEGIAATGGVLGEAAAIEVAVI
ncbi:hypothetical protein DYB38_005886 [Aphanomyces astaci]|uniref:DDE-1 domain-containing protein n=1 Tax=Aphanomyces astaci TaxID=112090 RepID=A0A397DBC4_APHAT|nr:hypothetical protein DYB38_005886 [Aphanomyces astaci]